MKKFTFLIVALLVAAMGFAQVQMAYKVAPGTQYKGTWVRTEQPTTNVVRHTRDNAVIFSEGFEFSGTDLENGWTSYDQDGDSYNWQVWTNKVHTGSGAMASASYDNEAGALTPNNWLISPAIDLTSQTGTIKAAYWVAGQDNSWPREHYKVCVSTSADVASFSTILYEETIPASGWFERTVDLSSYIGQTIYIAFVHYNITDMYMLVLDDFSVYVDQSTDAAVTEVTAPTHGDYSTCALTNAEQVKINILNNGGAAISNFEVSYTINGGAAVTETVTASVAPAQTYEYTFTQTADLSAVGAYEIAASINLTGDEVAANNNANMTITNGDATIRIHAQTNAYGEDGHSSWTVTNTLTNQVVAERTESWQWYIEVNDYVCVDATGCYTVEVLDADGLTLQDGDNEHTPTYLEILYNGTQVAGSTEPNSFAGPSLVAERLGSGCSTDPEIIAATTTFTFTGIVDEATASQSTTIRTYNIDEEITATTEAPFEVSADNTTFGATAQLAAENSTLYIRYNPTEAGTQSGTVVLSYTGAENVTITVTGTAISCDPITDLPYTQTFDELTECWGVISNNEANAGRMGIYDLDGESVFRFSSYSSADDYNQYLITPKLGYENAVKLSFDYATDESTETFSVLVSSTNSDIASFSVLGEEIIATSADMTAYEAIIPAGTKYVAINYYSNYQYYMYVDNLTFSELAANEIELVSLNLNEESGCGLNTVTPTVTVRNGGLNGISSFSLSYTVNEGEAVNATVTPENPIASGTTYVYEFPEALNISELGTYTIAVTIAMEGDADDTNNDAEVSISNLAPQTIPYENELDAEEDVLGFHFIDADADDNTWALDEDEGALYIESSEANDYAITSCITVEEAGDYVFDFDYAGGLYDDTYASWGYIFDYKENFQIVYGTAPTAEAMTNVIATYTDVYEENLVNAKRGFSIAAAGTYYFGILCNSTEGDHLTIDNISIYAAPTTAEIALTSVAPANGTTVQGGQNINISGVVTNNGSALTSYKVTYTVDGGEAVEYTVSDINVAFGETDEFTHATPVVLSGAGEHTIVVTVSNPNGVADGDDSDNSKTITLNVVDCSTPISTFPYVEDFESGINPCWTIIDADGDGNNWMHSSDRFDLTQWTAHSGTGAIVSESYRSSALTPDNWAITPAITLPEGSPASVSFFAAAQDAAYPAEHYGVYVSTTTTDPSAFTLIWDETMDANGGQHREQGAWGEKHADLSNYAGQTIYIAFRHFNCSDEFVFLIDDVTVALVSAAKENIAEAIEVYPNPTSSMVTIANAEGKDIIVVNSLGQVVASIENAAANQTIDVSNFANGTYFVKVDAEVVKLNVVK